MTLNDSTLGRIALLCALAAPGCLPDTSLDDGGRQDAQIEDAGAADGQVGDAGGDDGEICPQTEPMRSGETDTVRCIQGFADRPYVRPPADTDEILYVSFNGEDFVSRSGPVAVDVPAAIVEREFGHGAPVQGDRYGYAIYKLSMSNGAFVDLSPAVIVDDQVFLNALTDRHFQGVISRKLGPDTYEVVPTLPVALTVRPTVRLSAEPDDLHGFPIHTVDATIANISTGITRPDGACLPALGDAGAEDPFGAIDPTVTFSRIPNMHGNFDDVVVVEWPAEIGGSNMGSGGYQMPILLASPTAPEPIVYGSEPHGAPGASPSLHVTEVAQGAPCTP